MKVLMLIDKPNWAYHSIARAIEKYNDRKELELRTEPIKKNEGKIKKIYKKYDRFFVLGWQTYERIGFLPQKHTLTGLHSYHSWDNKKTTPENKDRMVPPKKLIKFLNRFHRINAVSDQLAGVFRRAGVEKVYYTANGVDTDIFKYKPADRGKDFFVGYSGSKAHDWRKGVSKFIKPATKKVGAKIKIAMLSTDQYVDLTKMPDFYQGLHAYVCASSSEGMSLSVLEAVACGCPIISTRVGGCVDIIQDGVNGFLVDRDVIAIADKIRLLKEDEDLRKNISIKMDQHVQKKWSWSVRARNWLNFVES